MKKLLILLLLIPALLNAQPIQLADNGSTTAPIQVWRDNQSEVMRVADGAFLGIGNNNPQVATKVFIPFGPGRTIPAIMYLAPGAPADAPCFIFAAGKGEQMNKEQVNETTLTEGYTRLLNSSHHQDLVKNCEKYGFNLLIPLFVQAWNDWIPDWQGGKYMETCIDWAVANMPISSKRVIPIGFSSGACAVIDACVRNQTLSSKIAGVVSCAPGTIMGTNWNLIKENSIPIWIFHCEDDRSPAPYSGGLELFNKLQKMGLDPAAKFTHPASGDHGGSIKYATTLAELYTTALTWKSDYAPVPPPVKTIVGRFFYGGWELVIYSDGSTDKK